MKTKIAYLLSIGLCLAWIGVAKAANQPAIVDGNYTFSSLGIVQNSTPSTTYPAGNYETRNQAVTDHGYQIVQFIVRRSSFVDTQAASNEQIANQFTHSTFTVITTTNATIVNSTINVVNNPNVFDICSPTQPCVFRGWEVGEQAPMRVRVWDTRGATTSMKPVFEMSVSTYQNHTFNIPFSSGVTVMVGGTLDSGTKTSPTPASGIRPQMIFLWDNTNKDWGALSP